MEELKPGVMEPASTDKQDAEMSERASATADRGERAAGENRATVGAPESGAIAAHGRHHPVIGWRKFAGSTATVARRAPDLRAIWFDHRLDPAFREELMVAVASANTSRQCSFAHHEWALAEGLPTAELAALEGLQAEAFDARKWAAIDWARAAAPQRLHRRPRAVDANFRRQFSPQEQADIELVARTMTWMNRTSNTVDACWSRLHGTPVRGSGLLGELTALLLYAAITPVVLGVLSTKQRRSPISLVAGVAPFFREFEARER